MTSFTFDPILFPRRSPYNRQQKLVITATKSFIKSSLASASRLITTNSHPIIGSNNSKYLNPNRVNRSLCSTTTREGCNESNLCSFGRASFIPDAISLTTDSICHPLTVQKAAHLSACRSKSAFLSWDDTRAYITALEFNSCVFFSGSTITHPDGVL